MSAPLSGQGDRNIYLRQSKVKAAIRSAARARLGAQSGPFALSRLAEADYVLFTSLRLLYYSLSQPVQLTCRPLANMGVRMAQPAFDEWNNWLEVWREPAYIGSRGETCGDRGQDISMVAELRNKGFKLGVPFQSVRVFLLRNRQPRDSIGGAGLGIFADPIKIDVLRHAEGKTACKVVIVVRRR